MKDVNYSARFIFLSPPALTELEARLKRRGSNDPDAIKARLEIAVRELEKARIEGFHDVHFVNDDLDATYKKLHSFIFGIEESTDGSSPLTPLQEMEEVPGIANAEVEMADVVAPTPDDTTADEGKDQKDDK